MSNPNAQKVKTAIRETYAQVAEGRVSCCGGVEAPAEETAAAKSGYAPERLENIPEEVLQANASCGNPVEHAEVRPGEVVLDLGSGGGLDCFISAGEAGPTGRVIGLDMTDAMLEKAEANRQKLGLENVEFRKGEMEAMPIEDESVDIIISNCVINLSPDKDAVFRESFRVLRPGGRFVVSDIIQTGPAQVQDSMENWCACLAGAIPAEKYLGGLRDAGFEAVEILNSRPYVEEGLESATIRAIKPEK